MIHETERLMCNGQRLRVNENEGWQAQNCGLRFVSADTADKEEKRL